MPEAGVALQPTDSLLTSQEVVKVAELFVAAGVDKVCSTSANAS
jgi:molybdenum cofactor biosynthesis enzyme MoaA